MRINKDKKTIAVCCATLRELSVLEPMDAICQHANENGYNVQIFQSFEEMDGNMEIYIGEKSVFELIDYDKICGLIIFGERIKDKDVITDLINNAKMHDIPVVSLDQKNDGCVSVLYDYSDAFEQIVKHLVEYHKFKRFLVMAGIKDNAFSDERLNAVRKVFTENNLILNDEDIYYGGFWADPTIAAMNDFFESGREIPEAIIAFNDAMAITVIDALQSRGYKVPDDVVVTGFDGISFSDTFVPRLTTAKQQFDKAGIAAVDIILKHIDGEEIDALDISIPFAMKIRQSCGCNRVDLAGVTGNISDLYYEFDTCKRFGTYLDHMTRSMIAKDNIEGLISAVNGYFVFVDSHDYINVCVNKAFLKDDDEFYQKECDVNEELLNADEDDRVVILSNYHDDGFEERAIRRCIKKTELLPYMDEWDLSVKNSIIFTLHAGEEIYGHMVVDYKIGNRDSYKTKMFVNKICTNMLLIRQRSLLKNSNRELTLLTNKLEEMYILDPMTGINNRRGFYQKYEEALNTKKEGYITVISVDLDRLKPINDTYGHKEGDFAIKSLSEALAEFVGDNGIYARFGGDEFVALLFTEGKDVKISDTIYKDISSRLKDKKITENKEYDIECSLGAVQVKNSGDLDIEQLISKSDKLLYSMKKKHHEKSIKTSSKYRVRKRI